MQSRFFRTIPLTLNLLALGALVLLILKIFVLNQIPEPFRGMRDLGLVFEGLLASVLASYIFYLIVVHVKELRDEQEVSPHITRWAQSIVRDCTTQLSDFSRASGVALELATLTEAATESALAKSNPHLGAPLVLFPNGQANWIQYWDYHRKRSRDYNAKIMAQLRFVDARLVALLTAIDDNGHFQTVQFAASAAFKNTDMAAFAGQFYSYCDACRKLSNFLSAKK